MPKKNPIGIGISPKIQPKEPTRTPEEEHDLLYSRYMGLNAYRNMKQRAPSTPEIERSFKETGGLGKVQTRSEDSMFLQGNCYGNEKAQTQAFSKDRDERQGFINNHCSTCPIKSGCLNYALERPNDTLGAQGVWGGTHPEEREGYRRSLTEGLINPLDTKWFPEYKKP
jgi:hypothetical protein